MTTVKKKLFPFQENAVERMLTFNGETVYLFDDMGLGKTLQVLETIIRGDMFPALIIPPKGLVLNWYNEILKWWPDENPVIFDSSEQFVNAYVNKKIEGKARFFIAWHNTLAATKRNEYLDFLTALDWRSVVIDEAHEFRNPKAGRTAGLWKFTTTGQRFVLTGTPTVNSDADLFPLLRFGEGKSMGTYQDFAATFTYQGYGGKRKGSRNRPALVKMLGNRWIRRTKSQVLKWLPPKTVNDYSVEMPERQRMLYDSMLYELWIELTDGGRLEIEQSQGAAIALLTRLRQLNCDPRILGSDAPSAKTEAILNLAETHEGKVVIYSNFETYLKLLEIDFHEKGIETAKIVGSQNTYVRKANENRFQNDPSTKVLLVSMAAGGVGLNLTAASMAIIADEWWNAMRMQQAIDRSHRPGQVNQLTALIIQVENSIDEQIREIVSEKEISNRELLVGLAKHMEETAPRIMARLGIQSEGIA